MDWAGPGEWVRLVKRPGSGGGGFGALGSSLTIFRALFSHRSGRGRRRICVWKREVCARGEEKKEVRCIHGTHGTGISRAPRARHRTPLPNPKGGNLSFPSKKKPTVSYNQPGANQRRACGNPSRACVDKTSCPITTPSAALPSGGACHVQRRNPAPAPGEPRTGKVQCTRWQAIPLACSAVSSTFCAELYQVAV